ncbi:eukaryotic translation initiation factor 3 subunit E-A-like [Ornithodoros turicata]|uniref:Eukaryotic translation initiation factor 3 subunit E n=3 Tax=Ornithodorinae TaxID=2945031 RepID=A0A2R5LB78_9ACAR
MAEWDLTAIVGQYIDLHMVLPLLEFLQNKNIYVDHDLSKAKLHLLNSTKMVDFNIEVFKQCYPDQEVPDELREKRQEVLAEISTLSAETKPLIDACQTEEVCKYITNVRDSAQFMKYLMEQFKDINPTIVDSLYQYAKLQFECGNYSVAGEYLYLHRFLIPPADKNHLNNLWGKLGSEILMQNWDVALDDLNRLKEYIDTNNVSTPLESLQQRTWLIHWSLFVFFNHGKGRDLVIDLFLSQPQYLNAIQTMCPHILRYLTCAVITNKQKRGAMRDLVKVIQQESYAYHDPITEFVECLFVNFDFDGAQQKLRECEVVLSNDFFLVACLEDFMENARLFIFETFCRIHQCISIGMLAEKINMEPEEAEKWIVNLIRNARLDAKIDSKLGHVVMGTQAVSPYQQLIDKTQQLLMRTQLQTSNLEQKLAASNPDRLSHWGAQNF